MITNRTIAELLIDIAALCEAIDDDPDAPTATPARMRYALDMMIDDAHEYELDDDCYPYALSPAALENISSRFGRILDSRP